MAISPGGRPMDDSPFSASTTDNWVARSGGLPDYIRGIAHALVRGGKPESEAIPAAIDIVKTWAAGGGKVRPQIRAAAAAALAEFEGKAKATDAKTAVKDATGKDKKMTSDVEKKFFSAKVRAKDAKTKVAMDDGSYPISSQKDVDDALKDYNRTGQSPAVKAHIITRAKALGAEDRLPLGWIKSQANVVRKGLPDQMAPNELPPVGMNMVPIVAPTVAQARTALGAAHVKPDGTPFSRQGSTLSGSDKVTLNNMRQNNEDSPARWNMEIQHAGHPRSMVGVANKIMSSSQDDKTKQMLLQACKGKMATWGAVGKLDPTFRHKERFSAAQ